MNKDDTLTAYDITYYVESAFMQFDNIDKSKLTDVQKKEYRDREDNRTKVCKWSYLNQRLKQSEVLNPIAFLDEDYKEKENERDLLWKQIQWLFEEKPHFTNPLTPKQLELLCSELRNGGFVFDAFNLQREIDYVFGGKGMPVGFHGLKWQKNKQLLLELLTGINPSKKNTDLNKIVPKYFVDKKGNPIHLAKPKHVESTDHDKLKKIIENLATM